VSRLKTVVGEEMIGEATLSPAGARLAEDERLTYSNGVRKALYRDPDGNELGFGGAPLDTGQ
jgi:hypothetical protein